jgi:hypothetical protein
MSQLVAFLRPNVRVGGSIATGITIISGIGPEDSDMRRRLFIARLGRLLCSR